MLRDAFSSFFPAARIEALARELGVQKRVRKLDPRLLVVALVLSGGRDDAGRMRDVHDMYNTESSASVVRGSFYAWFDDALADLLETLLMEALAVVRAGSARLDNALCGVLDWIVVDSTTVSLRQELASHWPGTSGAALKVHKHFSLGRGNLVDLHLSAAREHDSPHLRVDASWAGRGLLVDLGYASFELIRDCREHEVALVLRLKRGWSAEWLEEWVEDRPAGTTRPSVPMSELLDAPSSAFNNRPVDYDVAFSRGERRVEIRLVGVPGNEGRMHWCLTTLPRETHTPRHVGNLYRTRWEIELDNRRDKGAAALDQIRAATVASTRALLYASLLRTVLTNHLVEADHRSRKTTAAPLHGFALGLALTIAASRLLWALETDSVEDWERAAERLRQRGHDPNWRNRPSVRDRLQRVTAPPGRRRYATLSESPSSAAPFRRQPPKQSNSLGNSARAY